MKQSSFQPSRAQKQQSFKFGTRTARSYGNAAENALWAEITAADPVKYAGQCLKWALQALHRAGRPHQKENCPLCEEEQLEKAA
jgi:hypothetical protein